MPKKAMKGGRGKGGGKTEEERLLSLQQRAQAEQEMAKKREDVLAQFLKDKLQVEEKNTALNLQKINESWMLILRQTVASELRRDITVLKETFERDVDHLDSIIESQKRELLEKKRRSAQAQREHLQRMECLRALQVKQLKLLQQQWEDVMQQLSSRLSSGRKQRASLYQQQRANLEDKRAAVLQQHETAMNEIHTLYGESKAAIESIDEDWKDCMAVTTEYMLEESKLQDQEVLQLCSELTERLSRMENKTQQLFKETDAVTRRAMKMQEAVTRLRTNMNSSKTGSLLEEQHLKAANDKVKRENRELQNQLDNSRKAVRIKLIALTVHSDKAAKTLKGVITKGERVLRAGALCRKLEQEVSPPLILSEEVGQETTGLETEEPVKETPELQHLMKRINTAVLQRDTLRKEKRDLIRERQQLQLEVHQVEDFRRLSDHEPEGAHDLLTVGPALTTSAPLNTNRHHTVIEGAHAAKHSAVTKKKSPVLIREKQQLQLEVRQRKDTMKLSGQDLEGAHALLTVGPTLTN